VVAVLGTLLVWTAAGLVFAYAFRRLGLRFELRADYFDMGPLHQGDSSTLPVTAPMPAPPRGTFQTAPLAPLLHGRIPEAP